MKNRPEHIREIAGEIRIAIWEFLQDTIKDEAVYGNDVDEGVVVDLQGRNVVLTVPNTGRVKITVSPISQRTGK